MTGPSGEQGRQRGIRRVQWWFRCAIASCALIDLWLSRNAMNPDSVSYLDMGDLYWRRDWQAALNSCWSPLYSWLTGLMFLATKPAPRWEFPEVHLLNYAILLATLFCFEFFWGELLASAGGEAWVGASQVYAWVLGYLAFAWVHFSTGAITMVTPDLLVAALVYLTSGMMLRFAGGRMGAASAVPFGILLGVGYLAKTAMLPFAAVMILTMCAVAWRRHRRKSPIAITLAGCLAISLPFIAALSWNAHRLTAGDAPKLNQGWFVNSVHPVFFYWQGSEPAHTDALHPPRKVFAKPEVYEYAAPVAGTYPLWYDPSYWYAGLDASVHPAREIAAFLRNMATIWNYLFKLSGILTTVVLMMLLLSDRVKDYWRRLMSFWPILAPAAAVFFMYSMVFWTERYTSGLMLVGCGAAIASISISGEERRTRVLRAASLILGAMAVGFAPHAVHWKYLDSGQQAQYAAVAERLRAMGVEPGDRVALIADGDYEECWARLAKVKIVAEVPHSLETGDAAAAFWNSSPETELAVLDILKRTGAKAAVADTPPSVLPAGWAWIGSTGRAVFFFR